MSKNVSETAAASLINFHGQITSLTNGFKLEDPDRPFKIYIRPKVYNAENIDIMVNCKLILDYQSSSMPFNFYQWSPANIIELAANSIDLDAYDVYYGTGVTPNK